VIALGAGGPPPARIVLVPSEAHAHALRVELAARGPQALAGTQFFTASAAARAVLEAAGVTYRIGEEVKRPLRLRKLFRARPVLATYRGDDLRTKCWEAAFAATIEQLERAALGPDDLDRLGDPRALDLATVWRAVDDDAGTSCSVPRLMVEAQGVLADAPRVWPFDGPVLAAVDAGIDAAHARLLQGIPGLTLGVIPGRPVPRQAVERMRSLLGDAAA